MLTFFNSNSIFLIASQLRGLQSDLSNDNLKVGSGDTKISEERFQKWQDILLLCKELADEIGLRRTKERIQRIDNITSYRISELMHHAREMDLAIMGDLNDYFFLFISNSDVNYFNNDDLFGIKNKFPQANEEIKAAGTCFATGNYTACVFHLMRSVEHGLRIIAKQLKVPFPTTYELKTWEQLLKAIESEISKIINQPKTPKRLKDLKFYNSIPLEFRFFKDAWRNHVMHTRARYDRQQAMSIMSHVKELMQHIANGK